MYYIDNDNRYQREVINLTRTLQELLPGERATIRTLRGNGAIKRRIMDMGLIPGVEITMERFAPLGDPIEIKSSGFHISLRKEEADTIEVD